MAPMRPWTRPVSGWGWLPYKIRVQKLLTAAVLGLERIRSGSQRQATATNASRSCKTLVPTVAHAWRPCFDYLQHHGSQTFRSVVAVPIAATVPTSLPSTGTESRCQTRCNAAIVIVIWGPARHLFPLDLCSPSFWSQRAAQIVASYARTSAVGPAKH